MQNYIINWLVENYKTISILWNGVTLATQLFLGDFFPQNIEMTNDHVLSDEYSASEIYDLASDGLGVLEDLYLSQEEEEEEEEDQSTNNNNEGMNKATEGTGLKEEIPASETVPDIEKGDNKNETEQLIDVIERVDEVIPEETTDKKTVATEEEEKMTEEEINTEKAIEAFKTYYYSHGQSQELSEEISAY